MSQSTSTPTSPTILLFARGTLALLDLWPALTIAVAEQWGGPESSAKKTWLASTIIDEFETRATYFPLAPSAPSSTAPLVDPATANDPPLDLDDLADLLQQIMSDEFEANIDDGSVDSIAADLVRLWRDILAPSANAISPETIVSALERKADEVKRSGVNASSGGGPEEESGGSSGDEDDEMEVDGEAPQLVEREREERQEPEVDEDGFTMVKKGKRR